MSESSTENYDGRLNELKIAAGLPDEDVEITFGLVFWHNIQAVLVMLLFGVLSFGILGELAFAVNIAVVGGLMAALQAYGLPAGTMFLAGILPHGIFEIPAIMLASTGVLYFGAAMVTPNPSKTLGEVFIHALADWFKIGVGVILPFLFIAALIEVYITPIILAYATQ